MRNPGPHVDRPQFSDGPLLRRTHLIAATASQYAFIVGPLLRSFKTSPCSNHQQQQKQQRAQRQVEVNSDPCESRWTPASRHAAVS